MKAKALSQRFWSQVDRDGPTIREDLGPCWLWRSHLDKDGYGHIKLGGKTCLAHRVSYEISTGSAGGLCVLHRCDNRCCVNPAHLFLGTNLDNTRDREIKGRGPQGERNSRAKLTVADARMIRSVWGAPGVTLRSLADELGVVPGTIWMVVNGVNWPEAVAE